MNLSPDAVKEPLYRKYPKRVDVLWVIGAALLLLVVGLFAPTITIKQLILFKDTFSIALGIYVLFHEGQAFLGVLVFVFSVLFPLLKLGSLLAIWLVPFTESRRERVIHWLHRLGKWSMLDVYVMSITIVVAKLSGFADAEARYGLYVFCAAVILSIIATYQVDHILQARKKEALP